MRPIYSTIGNRVWHAARSTALLVPKPNWILGPRPPNKFNCTMRGVWSPPYSHCECMVLSRSKWSLEYNGIPKLFLGKIRQIPRKSQLPNEAWNTMEFLRFSLEKIQRNSWEVPAIFKFFLGKIQQIPGKSQLPNEAWNTMEFLSYSLEKNLTNSWEVPASKWSLEYHGIPKFFLRKIQRNSREVPATFSKNAAACALL